MRHSTITRTPEQILRVHAAELRAEATDCPPDHAVAQLASPGLSGNSVVVVPTEPTPPAWIVLDYADGRERLWRRRSDTGGTLSFALVEDTASTGYVSARTAPATP